MATIKLTKNELREQQKKLAQLQKYLPTLQLKKALLQSEVINARIEIEKTFTLLQEKKEKAEAFSSLLSTHLAVNPEQLAKITEVKRISENIAGVDVPQFESIEFAPLEYSLFDTPPWLDAAAAGLRSLSEYSVRSRIAHEKKEALESELRMVSIRVNLFEKILIPKALKNIRVIKVFLGDQELAAVSRAKVAKSKKALTAK